MKVVERNVYERGDFVEITMGYKKGMVGTVIRHDLSDNEVEVATVDSSESDNDWEDDGDYFPEKFLKILNKKEYEDGIKRNKILRVAGLPVAIQFKRSNFLIGDNVVTPANAKKIAEFINSNMPKTKGKKK